jgi:YesN/AraC family two-component response regulator
MELNKILPFTKELKILYVEDEENILIHTKEIFDDIFYSVSTAINGEDGLLEYKSHHPEYFDIVITDIKMPKKDGITMIDDILKINNSQKIIAISSYNESNILMQLIQLGISNFIMKPFTSQHLINALYATSKAIYDSKEKEKLQNKITILNKKREILDTKMDTIEKIIQDISHQWKQPLSAIMMSASGMKFEKLHTNLSDEKLIKRCDDIIENADYLSKTIENCKLHFLESNDKSKFFISENLDTNISQIQKNLDENDIKIVKNFDTSIEIKSSLINFNQAISCILENAIEALKKCTSCKRYIFVDLYKDENNIYLSIKDNAKGIQKSIISDIFNLYITTKHRYVGTGLGLHKAYNIVRNDIGGHIDVSNVQFSFDEQNYTGAKFTITVPFDRL